MFLALNDAVTEQQVVVIVVFFFSAVSTSLWTNPDFPSLPESELFQNMSLSPTGAFTDLCVCVFFSPSLCRVVFLHADPLPDIKHQLPCLQTGSSCRCRRCRCQGWGWISGSKLWWTTNAVSSLLVSLPLTESWLNRPWVTVSLQLRSSCVFHLRPPASEPQVPCRPSRRRWCWGSGYPAPVCSLSRGATHGIWPPPAPGTDASAPFNKTHTHTQRGEWQSEGHEAGCVIISSYRNQ